MVNSPVKLILCVLTNLNFVVLREMSLSGMHLTKMRAYADPS